MSAVKRKLRNKSLKEECEIIHHIKKGMVNKEASKISAVPKNTFSVDEINKAKCYSALQETSSSTKKNT